MFMNRRIVFAAGADDCDFDFDGFCQWTNDPSLSASFQWLLGSGPTPSSSTGPSADHTSGSGTKFISLREIHFERLSARRAWHLKVLPSFLPCFA